MPGCWALTAAILMQKFPGNVQKISATSPQSRVPLGLCPFLVALIFRTCQLHTVWEFLHKNGGSERPAAWHGKLHWQGRQHQGKYQSRRLIDNGILYPRQDVQALPSEVSKVAKSLPVQVSEALSNLLKASSSTVSSALPAITKNYFQPQLPPWLLQP